jgi:hypothetical protein
MLPEVNKWVCDKHTCRLIGNDANGLGTGRVYSQEICENLPEAWPTDMQNNTCTTPNDLSQFYPLDANIYNTTQRLTVHGGAQMVREAGDPRIGY